MRRNAEVIEGADGGGAHDQTYDERVRGLVSAGAVVGVVAAGLLLAAVLIPRGDSPERSSAAPVLVTAETISSPRRSEVPYDVEDVRAAFKSGGVRFVASRLDQRGCLTDPSVLFPGQTFRKGDMCFRHAPELAHVIALTPSRAGRRGWMIMIYGNVGYARGDRHGDWQSRTEKTPMIRGQRFRLERAENVVVLYFEAADAGRIRELLDRL